MVNRRSTWYCLSGISFRLECSTSRLRCLMVSIISWGSTSWRMTLLCRLVDSHSRSLNITLIIPCCPWAISGFVAHIITFKTWALKLLYGPGWWRPHWLQVFLGFDWTACFPLSCFVPCLNLLKFLFPWELDPPRPNFSFTWSFSLFLISVSLTMRAIFTALWYISWKLS